ncbi:MAG: MBL fold metallo-hydrolase [Parasphingorhabdus sp.]
MAAHQAEAGEASEQAAKPSTQVVLLGTGGGPRLRVDRAQPANLLVVDGTPYLIDCGEGCVTQLVAAGYDPAQLRAVFLTHLHLDHTGGTASLGAFRWTLGASDAVTVYGPPGTQKFLAAGMDYLSLPGSVHASEVRGMGSMRNVIKAQDLGLEGKAALEIFRDDKVRVSAVSNSHFYHLAKADVGFGSIRSYSYRFDTADRSVVFTGDTGPSEAVEKLAKDADVLVTEVMDVAGILEQFKQRGGFSEAQLAMIEKQMRAKHLTPEEVGKLASAAGVKTVVLTHFTTPDGDTAAVANITAKVKASFSGEVIKGEDLQTL